MIPIWAIAFIAVAAIALIAGITLFAMRQGTDAYTVFYRCGGADIADPKTVDGIAVGTEVTECAIDVNGYTLGNRSNSQTITVQAGGNNAILFSYDRIDTGSEGDNGKSATSTIVGTWYLSSGDAKSLGRDDVADMWDFGLGSILDIGGDGSGSLTLAGKTSQFTWTGDAHDGARAKINGAECEMYLDGSTLVLSGYEDGKLYFSIESPEREHDGYILKDSDTSPYHTSILENLTDYELCLARNELFIRNGQKVESDLIAQHYSSLGLVGSKADANSLGPIENLNMTTIARIEWGRNSIYRNMLSRSRYECYLAYSDALDERASNGTIILAQLVDFDGLSETFEELLVVFSGGKGETVELLGYSDGHVTVEGSEEISELSVLSLQQGKNGCLIKSEPSDLEWGDAEDEYRSGTIIYQFNGVSHDYSVSLPVIPLETDEIATITEETKKTLKADYCDYGQFYGAWLEPVDEADDAWKQCLELQALGFDAWKVQPKAWDGLNGDVDTFRVTAGRFKTEEEARDAAAKLKKLGYTNITVSTSGNYHDF